MTTYNEYYFTSSDRKTKIHVNCWIPEKVLGVVQIAHGIAEYGKRYDLFARHLCENAFAVVANDHLGHGDSRQESDPPLYFGETNGWWNVVDDMEALRSQTAAEFPNIPYFIFGHSMGSFLARSYLIRYPGRLTGCVLCGTGHPAAVTLLAGKLFLSKEVKKFGKTGYSKQAENLLFGSYNHKFAPNRTESDWLSASEENVDAYRSDPLCGGTASVGLLQDLVDGLWFITRRKNLDAMDHTTPVLFIAGQNDPVGNMGKGVQLAYRKFLSAGTADVTIKLYEGLRHEILNEDARMDVYQDVVHWLKDKSARLEESSAEHNKRHQDALYLSKV